MSIVILDAFEGENGISNIFKGLLQEPGKEIKYFRLRDMNILPCRSCGACGYKSPGKCVVKDDAHEMLQAIAKGNALIIVTPIRFGGYNSTMKKAVDKFMNLGLPCYMVKQGHLLHPARYGEKLIAAIGINETDSREQAESFRKLVENNALNLQSSYRTLVLDSTEATKLARQEISRLLREVC